MQWQRWKKKIRECQKNMTEAEADALKMLSKMTEAAEGTMTTEVRVGALNMQSKMMEAAAAPMPSRRRRKLTRVLRCCWKS